MPSSAKSNNFIQLEICRLVGQLFLSYKSSSARDIGVDKPLIGKFIELIQIYMCAMKKMRKEKKQ